MEADVLWKAAMKPRLPTELGKHRQEAAGVSHISHSPCQRPDKEDIRDKHPIRISLRLILRSTQTGQFTCLKNRTS
jgi:hypothetical protein